MISNQTIKRLLVFGAVVATLVMLGPLLFQLFVHWQGGLFAEARVGEVKDAVGLNPWLEQLLSTLGTGIAFIAFWLIFSWNEKRVVAGFALLGTMSVVTTGYLWLETKEDIVDARGARRLRCFVEVAGSVRVMDKVEIDRKTGAVCRDITSPELAVAIQKCIERQKSGSICLQKLEQRPKQYWSAFNGGPAIIWYARDSRGKVDLFDIPGQHPILGTELRPVTRESVEEAELQFDKAEELALKEERLRQERQRQDARSSPVNAEPSASTVQGLAAMALPSPLARYLDTSTASKGGDAVAVVGPQEVTRSIVAQLPGPLAVSPFKQAFFDEQLFERALGGDAEVIRKAGLGEHYRRVYLVRVSSPRTDTANGLEGFTRADASVEFTEIDVPAATVIRRRNQAVTGRGFSREAALADMSESGVRQLMESLGR